MTSWIATVDGSDFGLDNLPLGIFSPPSEAPRPGVAIGDYVADLTALVEAELIDEPALYGGRVLNAFLACGRARWSALRARLNYLFSYQASEQERVLVEAALVLRSNVTTYLPIDIGDYVDFYSSIEHATNVGRLFRPTEPLGANYRHLPLGYHGRSSTIVIDGTLIPRPSGQRKLAGAAEPAFGPSGQLDFELELGAVMGPGNALGVPIPIERVRDHVYGYVLLDDWSARDIQAWESLPLGPFLAKSFATSISPWIVSLDALEPFRVDNQCPRPAAAAVSADRRALGLRYRVGRLAANDAHAGRTPRTSLDRADEFPQHVLARGAAAHPLNVKRLAHSARRSARQRDHFGLRARLIRLSARSDITRHATAGVAGQRAAHIPRRRRCRYHARCRRRRHAPGRFW